MDLYSQIADSPVFGVVSGFAAEWKPYTNPKTGKSGWISSGGKVSYTAPKQSAPSPDKKAIKAAAKDVVGSVTQSIQAGQAPDPAHVAALPDHLAKLTVKELAEVKKSLTVKGGKNKAEIVAKLHAAAQAKAGSAPVSPPPAPPPAPPEVKAAAEVANEKPDPNAAAPKPKVPAGPTDKADIETHVKKYLEKTGKTIDQALAEPGKVVGTLKSKGYLTPDVTVWETNYALQNLKTQQANKLLPPQFAKGGAKNQPNHAVPVEARPKLTTAEQVAVQSYTGSMYRPLNTQLRKTGEPPPEFIEKFDALQSAFAKAKKLDPPVNVVRGMTLTPKEKAAFMGPVESALASGNPVELHGFVSTSVTDKPISLFKGNVSLAIEATHGLDALPYTHYPHEKELILNHLSRFKVNAVHKDPNGNVTVRLTQIHPDDWEGAGPVETKPKKPSKKLIDAAKKATQEATP